MKWMGYKLAVSVKIFTILDPLRKEYGDRNRDRTQDEKQSLLGVNEHRSPSLTTSSDARRTFAAGLLSEAEIAGLEKDMKKHSKRRLEHKKYNIQKQLQKALVEQKNTMQEEYLKQIEAAVAAQGLCLSLAFICF